MNTSRLKYAIVFALFLSACGGSGNEKQTFTLQDTYWKLKSIAGVNYAASSDKAAYILLKTEDNGLEGFGGCNRIIGNYILSDNNQLIMIAASTKMFCNENMETETVLMQILGEVENYAIEGKLLTLYTGDKVLAVFQASNEAL